MEELTFSQFIRAFNEADKEMNIIYHRLARHYRLSDSVFWVLYLLGEAQGPMTQTKLCGALFLGVINNALPVIGISPFWQMAISGAVIVIAVLLNERGNRGHGRLILRNAALARQKQAVKS